MPKNCILHCCLLLLKTEKMFIMKKVDMYGVLRVQIDDGAQNGPGHLLKIFFVKRGMITQFHIYSLAYKPSQVLCHMHGVSKRRCFLLNSKMYANFKNFYPFRSDLSFFRKKHITISHHSIIIILM